MKDKLHRQIECKYNTIQKHIYRVLRARIEEALPNCDHTYSRGVTANYCVTTNCNSFIGSGYVLAHITLDPFNQAWMEELKSKDGLCTLKFILTFNSKVYEMKKSFYIESEIEYLKQELAIIFTTILKEIFVFGGRK